MKQLKVRTLFFILATFSFLASEFLQSQNKSLPLVVTYRKSFLGGSYVLKLQDTSSEQLNIWLDAREKIATFLIPAGKMIEIGWAQGFRFDDNDNFFIGGDGYDTIRQTMPNTGLSPCRIRFLKDGSLTINLSQSYLQGLLPKFLELPVKGNYSNILEVAITELPKIILKDRSDRIYANVLVHLTFISGKINIPTKANLSFVPFYVPEKGSLGASQIKVENIEINAVPKDWLKEVTKIINQLLPLWFSKLEFAQLDITTMKYCKYFNVREVNVRNGRLEIVLL
jgi:hypothetical protein